MSVGKYLYADELWEKTHHKSKETHSTDQGKTFSTNQACSRGSMGPPELANHLKKGPLTHNRPQDHPSSFQTKGEAVWPRAQVGRPWVASPRLRLPRVGSPLDVEGDSR